MRKIFILFIFCCVFTQDVASQALWDSLISVKNLINKDCIDEAESILNLIEDECVNSKNDSLAVLFYESRGVILWDKEKYEECIPFFLKTIGLYENLHIKKQNYLDAFVAIGYSYGRIGDYNNAERYYRKALLKSVTASYNDEFRPNVYKNLGNLYMEKGDTLLAQECYKRASVKDVEYFDFMNMNFIEWESSQWEQVNQLVNDKSYEEAANFYTNFTKTIKERKGNRYEAYLLAVYSRAILLSRYINNIDDAIPLFEELVNLSDSIDAPNENICGAYCNLALCYSQKGNYKAVDNVISKGLPYLSKANIQGYLSNMIYRFAGNGAYWKQDYPNAIKYYVRYFTSNERESGTNYEEITNQLSVSYIFSGHPEKAKDLLERLLSTDGDRLKRENAQTLATVYHNLGRAYMLLNYKSSALRFLTESKNLQNTIYGEVAERTLLYIQECQHNNE